MAIQSKAMYRVDALWIKIHMVFFPEVEQNAKINMKLQET